MKDDIYKKHIQILGLELGTLFNKLYNEYYCLQTKWQELIVLYGTSPKRIELMNSTAPIFFKIVEDCLWEDILLSLTRLTDPIRSCGKKNLTFQAIPSLLFDSEFCEIVTNLIKQAINSTNFARDWRNRHFAHRDLKLALRVGSNKLQSASRLKVKLGIKSLYNILDAIYLKYFESEISQELLNLKGGGYSLLNLLNLGYKMEQDNIEKIKSGNIQPEDLTLIELD